MKQKISILGCGWLGFPLAVNLTQNNFKVNGSATSLKKLKEFDQKNITSFLINLNKLENNVTEFLNTEILIISISEKNVALFKSLITQIEKSKVEKVLFISSTSVYENLNQVVTEKTKVKSCPLSEIETLFRNNTYFKTTIIRFGGLFGYDRKPINFISTNKKIENPEGYVNLIHRDDCIQIIEQIVKQNSWNETLNACADTHPTRRGFYMNEAKKALHKTPRFNEESLNTYKIVSSKRLKTVLNFSFKYANLMS